MWEVAVSIASIGATFFFFKIGKDLREDQQALKLLFVGAGLFLILICLNLGVGLAEDYSSSDAVINSVHAFYTASLYLVIICVFFFLIYFIYSVLMSFKKYAKDEKRSLFLRRKPAR